MASNCSRVRVCEEEFLAAKSNEYVDGEIIYYKKKVYVYVELGKEGTYYRSYKDDENTSYRLFRQCKIYYAETAVKRNEGDFKNKRGILKDIVIIYS